MGVGSAALAAAIALPRSGDTLMEQGSATLAAVIYPYPREMTQTLKKGWMKCKNEQEKTALETHYF